MRCMLLFASVETRVRPATSRRWTPRVTREIEERCLMGVLDGAGGQVSGTWCGRLASKRTHWSAVLQTKRASPSMHYITFYSMERAKWKHYHSPLVKYIHSMRTNFIADWLSFYHVVRRHWQTLASRSMHGTTWLTDSVVLDIISWSAHRSHNTEEQSSRVHEGTHSYSVLWRSTMAIYTHSEWGGTIRRKVDSSKT